VFTVLLLREGKHGSQWLCECGHEPYVGVFPYNGQVGTAFVNTSSMRQEGRVAATNFGFLKGTSSELPSKSQGHHYVRVLSHAIFKSLQCASV
jgi:hypothetical protein